MRWSLPHNGSTMSVLSFSKKFIASAFLVLVATSASAGELRYAINGIEDPLEANILAHVEQMQFGQRARLAERDFAEIVDVTERRAREGLRPFGYYAPEVTGSIERIDEETLLLTLEVRAGPPVRVSNVQIDLVGPGRDIEEIREWRRKWPLRAGAVLDQEVWEQQKRRVLDIAQTNGFLDAEFSEHVLKLDLVRNEAKIVLRLDTGPQYVFGDIDFGDHYLKLGVLESIPRFTKGDRYSSRKLDTFRIDLWKTGYFSNVEIRQSQRPETTPPQVDLSLHLVTTNKNTYQGSIGFGTDSGMRVQAQWIRRPISRNGDRLDVGIGWLEEDSELSVRADYRLPRPGRDREYWVASGTARIENLDLEIKRRPEDENFLKIANGDVSDYNFRFGNLRVRNLKQGDRQYFGTLFLQYLNSNQNYSLLTSIPELQGEYSYLLRMNDDVISLGYDFDLVDVRGKGFDAEGRRDRAYAFIADEAIGSSGNFRQVYVSTRRIFRHGERWKLLLRGEVGYTDADVTDLTINVEDVPVDLSVTRLPNFYRFKAGGGQSVRGYGFESLSNNNVGSNNIITASVAAEYRFFSNWSAAAFFDIGNAFNDWKDPNLHKGVGVGIRWYSIAGPIRVDVAQAIDFENKPWRIHITIGTPLL